MVLTQRYRLYKVIVKHPCFHTTMVLTQLSDISIKEIRCTSVSIPLWFLRNSANHHQTDCRRRFPYHYGSYATNKESLFIVGEVSFHTTMVLTQRKNGGNVVTIPRLVSIPLWFLRNWPMRSAHAKMKVSIPLWFLRNYVLDSRTRQTTIVSIPLWFLRNRSQRWDNVHYS